VDAGDREADGVLSTEEACGVIDQICETGRPIVILSGGEPLLREDIFTIARHGTDQGLRMAMGTSGILIDRATAGKLRDAGIRAVAVSLDSASPEIHDAFRGVKGVWEKAVQAIRNCREEGIEVQVNMSVMRPSFTDIQSVVELGTTLGIHDYQVFFPVPVGRARMTESGQNREYEALIREILLHYRKSGVNIRPTCAPQFRRIADELGIRNPAWGRGCIAGISYCRIYANGDVTPCPYLPVRAGNVRVTPFREIWNNSGILNALRDPDLLTGKCGICRYRSVCGGCRARAYMGGDAVSPRWCDGLAPPDDRVADLCGADPSCLYEPEGSAI
jgi:radical SAM protein with 4Fe4S-binding SPASM domain